VLWDLLSGDLVASFRGHNSAIRSVAFSPDGRSLVCGGHDGPLTVYDAQPRVERARRLKELRAAKDHAQAAIDRLPDMMPAELLSTLHQELSPDEWMWAQNLVLQRQAARNR
jgi:WD40 repeat protein